MSPRKKKVTYEPTETVWPAPENWKEQVIIKMRKLRIKRNALADAIGCTPSAITILFRQETRTSRLVEAVSKYVDVPPPFAEIHGERDIRWLEAGRALNKDDWQRMVEIAESLARKQPG